MKNKKQNISLDEFGASIVLGTKSTISYSGDYGATDPRLRDRWNVYNTTPYSTLIGYNEGEVNRYTMKQHIDFDNITILMNYVSHISQSFTLQLDKTKWDIKPVYMLDRIIKEGSLAIVPVLGKFQLLKYKAISKTKDFNGIFDIIEIVEPTSKLYGKQLSYYKGEYVPLNVWEGNISPQALILNYTKLIGALKNEMIFNGISTLPTIIGIGDNPVTQDENKADELANLNNVLADNNTKAIALNSISGQEMKIIDRRDNIDTYIRAIEYFENQLKEKLGIPVNDVVKKERMITSEIGQQQSIAQAIINRLYRIMTESFEELNEKFNAGIELILTKPSESEDSGFEEKEESESEQDELISE
jgi:hypothetical protein